MADCVVRLHVFLHTHVAFFGDEETVMIRAIAELMHLAKLGGQSAEVDGCIQDWRSCLIFRDTAACVET